MPVDDACTCEGLAERRLIELRVATRARKPPDVDERPNTGFVERRDELLDLPHTVAYGVDRHLQTLRIESPRRGTGLRRVAATLTWGQLRELAAFRTENGCAISVYVNLDQSNIGIVDMLGYPLR